MYVCTKFDTVTRHRKGDNPFGSALRLYEEKRVLVGVDKEAKTDLEGTANV
jgi:hypothetical protein